MNETEADDCAKRILANRYLVPAEMVMDARMLARHRLATRSVQQAGIEPGHPLYDQALYVAENYRIPVSTPTKKRKGRRA